MGLTPAAATFSKLVQQGALTNDVEIQLNNNFAAAPNVVATSQNTALAFGSFGTAITLLAATGAPGTYRCSVYGVVTTTITGATTWSFVLGYSDDKQAQTITVSTSSTLTAGTDQQGSAIIRSNNATAAAITITPTAASISAGVVAYSVILERLL